MNSERTTINRVIFVLSILGIIMAVYVLQSFLRQTGIVCLNGSGCELVRKSPVSYPFGIPVPAFGLVGYTGLAILSFLHTLSHPQALSSKLLTGMLGIAIFGICFVSWFTIMELFVIKGVCTWCAVSAVNMYVIFGLVIKSWSLSSRT
jgi:uncharacterized membrane protein